MRIRPALTVVLLMLAWALTPVPATGEDGQHGTLPDGGSTRPDFDLPAVQLRLALDRVLAEHAFLSIEAMRTGIAGGAEFEVAAEVLKQTRSKWWIRSKPRTGPTQLMPSPSSGATTSRT